MSEIFLDITACCCVMRGTHCHTSYNKLLVVALKGHLLSLQCALSDSHAILPGSQQMREGHTFRNLNNSLLRVAKANFQGAQFKLTTPPFKNEAL